MDIIPYLKKLKEIEPDPRRAGERRARLMMEIEVTSQGRGYARRVFIYALQSGSALALAVVLFAVVMGGVSTRSFFDPLGTKALDPVGLKAEVESIGTQIKLVPNGHEEISSLSGEDTTSTDAFAEEEDTEGETTPEEEPLAPIDEALRALME